MPRPLQTELSGFSDSEIVARVKTLVSKERATTLEILMFLDEIDRRRLYLTLGFGSLFDYSVRHLKYSASSAVRRIRTARCLRRFPEIVELLENGEVNLSTVSLVAEILTEENKSDLLTRIRNKSQRDVEALTASYRPPVALRDRVRPVCVAVPEHGGKRTSETMPPGLGQEAQDSRNSLSFHNRCGGKNLAGDSRGVVQARFDSPTHDGVDGREGGGSPSGNDRGSNATSAMISSRPFCQMTEQKLLIQFLASETFMKKYEEARALLSNRLGEVTFERMFGVLIDEFLERHDPEMRNERRNDRNTTTAAAKRAPIKVTSTEHSRHIPAAVRDKVFVRDKGRCTYIGRTGERCGATHGLHVDHIVPYGKGGRNTADNLRLLCAKHNRLEAERMYGSNAIRRFQSKNTGKFDPGGRR